MKDRPKGFLSNENIPHNSIQFEYLVELHEYLWRFIRVHIPGASGKLNELLGKAIEIAETKSKDNDKSTKP